LHQSLKCKHQVENPTLHFINAGRAAVGFSAPQRATHEQSIAAVTSLRIGEDLTQEDGALTSWANITTIRRRLNGGVEQILSKQAFPPAELMARLADLLGKAKTDRK